MHDLEAEITLLHRQGAVSAEAATAAAALESGRVFTLHRELLLALHAGILAIAAGAGLLVHRHFDRIGPVALLAGLLAAAVACLAFAAHDARRRGARTLAGDYVLLLGALLLTTAAGFGEVQFRWLGGNWPHHLLLLAVMHGTIAYSLDSRLVLSVGLAAFAAWMGVEAHPGDLWLPSRLLGSLGPAALACATLIVTARALHQRWSRRDFADVYDHFAANLAFWGALAMVRMPGTRWWGAVLLLGLCVLVGYRGYARGRESFVLYAVGYGVPGSWLLAAAAMSGVALSLLGLALVSAAGSLLWWLRARMKVGEA